MDLETKAEVINRMLREKFQNSLYLTAKYLLGYNDITSHTHGDMIMNLQSDTRRKLICMPRGTFKSSVSSVSYPIWCLMRDPNVRVLIDSEIYSNSKNFIREIRHKLESQQVADIFGPAIGPTWGEGEITVAWRNKPFKEASVTASGIEAVKVGQHYDIIICDDLNSDNNSRTPEARKKVIDHYRMLTSILEPNGTLVVVGTRYSSSDVLGWVLENEVNVKTDSSGRPKI